MQHRRIRNLIPIKPTQGIKRIRLKNSIRQVCVPVANVFRLHIWRWVRLMIDVLPLELCGPNGFGASKGHLFILNTKKRQR